MSEVKTYEVKTTEKICTTYDEVLEIFNNENLSVVDVFGPPPPHKRENGKWVWKKQPPIMGWKVNVKSIKN